MFHVEQELEKIREAGFAFSDDQLALAFKYLQSLLKKNRVMNLVSNNDEKNVVQRHFIDSLYTVKLLGFSKGARVLDIGSGGGFPSVPLKIFRPDLHITAVESIGKKARFLSEVATLLNFNEFEVITTRLSSNSNDLGLFDYCIGRAVSELREFAKLCLGFINDTGYIYTFKHDNMLKEEIKRLNSSRVARYLSIDQIKHYSLNSDCNSFCLVSLKKLG
jgi:16S rRNA (guanine527-N7)-methyltransferase